MLERLRVLFGDTKKYNMKNKGLDMITFVNRISGIKWMALELYVKEGADAWYIKGANVSLPKTEWEEKDE